MSRVQDEWWLEAPVVENVADEWWLEAPVVGDMVEQPKQPPPPRSFIQRGMDHMRDTAVVTAKGALGVPQAITGIADMIPITEAIPGPPGLKSVAKAAATQAGLPVHGWPGWMQERLGIDYEGAQQVLHNAYSAETQAAHRNVADAEGVLGKIDAALRNPRAIATTIGESIPLMAAGGAIGRAPALGKYGYAIGEGLVSAGSGAEQTRAETPGGLLSGKQAAIHAASGGLTGVVGVLGSKLASRLGIEDIDVLMAGGASDPAKRNILIKTLAGMLVEGGAEEGPQSIQEQIAQNLATGKPWYTGWDQAWVMGTITGGVMGGGTNLMTSLADLPHTPTRREWAKAVFGDISRYREAPSRKVRREQFKAAKQEAASRVRVDAPAASRTGMDRGVVPAANEGNVPARPPVTPTEEAGQPSGEERGAEPADAGVEPEGRTGVAERTRVEKQVKGVFGEEEGAAGMALMDAHAGVWAKATGRSADEWFSRVAAVEKGQEDDVSETALLHSAFHGSPHKFDKFTLDNIGTGEGAQAYGWGLYFADSESVARFYRDKLGGGWLLDGKPIAEMALDRDTLSELNRARAFVGKDETIDDAIKRVRQERKERQKAERSGEEGPSGWTEDLLAAEKAMKKYRSRLTRSKGSLYKVDLAPSQEEYLLWDKPLSEQSEKVKKALREVFPDGSGIDKAFLAKQPEASRKWWEAQKTYLEGVWGQTGEQFYTGQINKFYETVETEVNAKSAAEWASKSLHKAGIRGIKYADQDSRFAPPGQMRYRVRWSEDGTKPEVFEVATGQALDRQFATFAEADEWIASQEQESDRTHNYVIFDDADIAIEEVLESRRRGRVTGAVQFAEDGRATIVAFQRGDVATLVHEVGHIFRRSIGEVDADLLSRAERDLGVTDGNWTVEAEEAFAGGFERYLRDGRAPTATLTKVFEQLRDWLLAIYSAIRGTALERNVSPELRGVFDRMLGGKAAPASPQTPPPLPGVPGGPGTVSTQNAYTQAQRAVHGMNPKAPVVTREWVKLHGQAMAMSDAEVTKVVDELRNDPKSSSDQREFVLLRRMNEIENQHASAVSSGDMPAAAAAEAQLVDIYTIAEKVGSEEGRALNARKAWIRDDNSLLGSIRRATKKNGRPLTEIERQQLVERRQELDALEAALAERERQQVEAAAERTVSEAVAKRQETLKSRYEKVVNAILDAYGITGVTFANVEAEAKRRVSEEAEAAKAYNYAYRQAAKATGLWPKVIDKIEDGQLVAPSGRPYDINEYGRLDEKAPMLAREYPELGIQSTPADAEQTGNEAADLVKVLKRGIRHVPGWHEKLDEVAHALVAERGRELPLGFSLEREVTQADRDFEGRGLDESESSTVDDAGFDWGTGTQMPPRGGKPKPLTAKEKAERAGQRLKEASAELLDSLVALGPLKFAEPADTVRRYDRFQAALADAALACIEYGIRSFNAAVVRLTADMGRRMTPMVREAFRKEWDALVGEGVIPSPVIDPNDDSEFSEHAQKVLSWVVQSGVTDTQQALDEVHAELQTIRPNITREESGKAASGYGQFKPLNKDAVSLTRRRIRGELQQHSKIDDLERAIAEAQRLRAEGKSEAEIAEAIKEFLPKKTGVERRTPEQAERELISQVEDLKKEIPVSTEGTERQLKTRLATAKTAVLNQIENLEAGRPGRKPRTPGPTDAELEAHRKRRDKLQAAYDEMNPRDRKKRTPEQETKATLRGLDRAIEDLEGDLGRGYVGRPGKPVSRTSPEIDAKRKKLARLKELREEIRELDPEFQKDEYARRLAARKQMLKRKLAAYEDRWARKDFAKKPVRRSPEDEETLRLRHQISEANKRQRAAEDRIARANRLMREKIAVVPLDVSRTIKSVWSSVDASFLLRQGVLVAAGHPIRAVQQQGRSLRAALSDKEFFALQEGIAARDNARSGLYGRAKLELLDISGPLVSRSEEYQSTFVQKIPYIGGAIKASERAFVAQGNQMRADLFDSMIATMAMDPGNVSDAEAKAIANYVNIATWRGNVAGFEQTAAQLGAVIWTPRGVVSRFQYLFAQPLLWPAFRGRLSGRAAKVIAWEYGRTLAGMSIFYGTSAAMLLAAFGTPGDNEERDKWNITFNPYSPDFGKVRIGRTRIDPMGGLSQVTRLTTRESTNAVNALYQLFGGRPSKQAKADMKDTLSIAGRFLHQKFAPAASMVTEIMTSEDYDREQVTLGGVAAKAVRPIIFEDVYTSIKEHGVPEGMALTVLAIFGMGLTYHEPERPPPQKWR